MFKAGDRVSTISCTPGHDESIEGKVLEIVNVGEREYQTPNGTPYRWAYCMILGSGRRGVVVPTNRLRMLSEKKSPHDEKILALGI